MTANHTGTCATCRYASTDKRPKIMSETGFDDQLMFEDADKDETHYTCRAFGVPTESTGRQGDAFALCEHAGKEIGTQPITCAAYAAPEKVGAERLSELDAMIARREKRGGK